MEVLPLCIAGFVIWNIILVVMIVSKTNEAIHISEIRKEDGERDYRYLLRIIRRLATKLGYEVTDYGDVYSGKDGIKGTPVSLEYHNNLATRLADLETFLNVKYVTKPGTETKQVYEKTK